jgi:uncharacterized membrane protein YphA (DoxX/SURF4 family)
VERIPGHSLLSAAALIAFEGPALPVVAVEEIVPPPQLGNRQVHEMNILLWVLQILAAFLYAASGVMKVFMFDKVSGQVPSFGALPREAWMALGVVELVCTVGLIVPAALHWQPSLTVVAAAVLAIESLVFIGVHVKYHEIPAMILSGVLGLVMAFIAYGRMVLKPIL